MPFAPNIKRTPTASNERPFCWTTCTNFSANDDLRRKTMKRICLFFLLSLCLFVTGVDARQNASWKPIDDAMGRQGQDQPDGTHRFGMPRSDLKVTANGVELKAGFALGSWAAFRNMGNHMDVMGDLVLTEAEVGPVMQKLVDSGIDVTAVHNHLLGESPLIMYMHIHGMGEGPKLASALRGALALTQTPAPAPAAGANQDLGFDSKQLDGILGYTGRNNGGVYQYSVPRAEKITENGMAIPNSMGVATAINFQPTTPGKAAITGDFVLT